MSRKQIIYTTLAAVITIGAGVGGYGVKAWQDSLIEAAEEKAFYKGHELGYTKAIADKSILQAAGYENKALTMPIHIDEAANQEDGE